MSVRSNRGLGWGKPSLGESHAGFDDSDIQQVGAVAMPCNGSSGSLALGPCPHIYNPRAGTCWSYGSDRLAVPQLATAPRAPPLLSLTRASLLSQRTGPRASRFVPLIPCAFDDQFPSAILACVIVTSACAFAASNPR